MRAFSLVATLLTVVGALLGLAPPEVSSGTPRSNPIAVYTQNSTSTNFPHSNHNHNNSDLLVSYKINIATWNVNGQSPDHISLSDWLARTRDPPDIYAIGFQELDLSKKAFFFNKSAKREDQWLQSVRAGLHPKGKYTKIKHIRLVGMTLIVFVKQELVHSVRNVVAAHVGTGMFRRMGNKGGVAIRFDLEGTSFCFVNCHLAANVEELKRRNQDYQQIVGKMSFDLSKVGLGVRRIDDHDKVFWFGDMNYRIDPAQLGEYQAKMLIADGKYSEVLKYDQLRHEMKLNHVFGGYTEGQITFRPTYKYDIGTNNWDTSSKRRYPAWCDRILWKGDNTRQIDYVSIPSYTLSDHKPIASLIEAKIRVVNTCKR